MVPWVGSDLSWQKFSCSCSSVTANCVSYRGAGRRARYLKYFLAFKESKNGTLFKCTLESVFLH